MLGTGYYNSWVLAGNVRTHYSWAGHEGPAVVLTHGGGPGSSGEAGWRLMLPYLAKEGFRVFAPDQLSMGQTDARPHAWPVLGHQSLVNHVFDFIEALCLDEVCVVGNSQGAYVAAKVALDHPERVRRAFFIGSATIAAAMGVDRPDAATNAGMKALREYDYSRDAMKRFLLSIVNDSAKVTDALVDYRHQMANRPGIRESRQTFETYVGSMRKVPKLWERYSMKETLPQMKVPAKFIWGKQDLFAPVEMGHRLAERLPNIPFEYVDAGHQCQNDNPEVVNRMVSEFFKEG